MTSHAIKSSVEEIVVLLCTEFVIPKDRQGAETDAKAKEPLFELAGAQSPTCTDAAVRYRGESEFQKHKSFIGV